MTQLTKDRTHTVHPENSPNQIEEFSFTYGEEYVYVRAVVDDAVLVHYAAWLSPEQYDAALCETSIFWGEPITSENVPTQKEIEEMISLGHLCDWEIVEEDI